MEAGRGSSIAAARFTARPIHAPTAHAATPRATPSDDSDRAARWKFGRSRARRAESRSGNGAARRAKEPGDLAETERRKEIANDIRRQAEKNKFPQKMA